MSSASHRWAARLYRCRMRFLQVVGDDLSQHRDKRGVVVERLGAHERKAQLTGQGLGLDIDVVQHLEVVRDKTGRADDHRLAPFAGYLLQDLLKGRLEPRDGRRSLALPGDEPTLDARSLRSSTGRLFEVARVGIVPLADPRSASCAP